MHYELKKAIFVKNKISNEHSRRDKENDRT